MAQTYQVVITQSAQQDLQQIIEYLLEEAGEEVAEKVRDAIEAEITGLTHYPHSKGLLKGTTSSQAIYRRVLIWSYRVIFTIEESKLLVLVVRIDHSKRNPESLKDLP